MADDPLLLDSDVFIDHLRGACSIDSIAPPHRAHSVMTRVELFAGHDPQHVLRDLLGGSLEIALSSGIAELAGDIRSAFGIAAPDAIIAATAIATHRVLVTRNIRHFGRVTGLRIRSPDAA